MQDLGQKWTSADGVVTYLGAKYYVTGYAGMKHPHARLGQMLMTTWNIGSTKDVEVAVWKELIKQGVASRVTVSLNGVIVEEYGVNG